MTGRKWAGEGSAMVMVMVAVVQDGLEGTTTPGSAQGDVYALFLHDIILHCKIHYILSLALQCYLNDMQLANPPPGFLKYNSLTVYIPILFNCVGATSANSLSGMFAGSEGTTL